MELPFDIADKCVADPHGQVASIKVAVELAPWELEAPGTAVG